MESSNSIGSLFTKQWPEMRHIFQSGHLSHYLTSGARGWVAEKLDGSNVAVTSSGVIASRRNILLANPTPGELDKTKFSGVKLHTVADMFPKLNKLKRTVEQYFPFLSVEVILYGELVQKGTATSVSDTYHYRARGYKEGGYYVFGGGVAFGECLTREQSHKAAEHLKNKGFSVLVQENENSSRCHLVLIMNDTLKGLLMEHDIDGVIHHEQLSLPEILSHYCQKLISNCMEGIVVNFGTEILKWKGLDESYPDMFMSEIENLEKESLRPVYEPIVSVANAARRHWASLKQERATLFRLEKAYKSALTKIKSLDDRRNANGVLETSEMTKFQDALELEMNKDSHCDKDYQERLPAFILSKLKSI